ncbi:MAG: DNA translocase FtsK [Clostridia bacterium]|nr:DNA translocase FtsK [Clostridia bacterium]
MAYSWKKDYVASNVSKKCIYSIFLVIFFAVFFHLIFVSSGNKGDVNPINLFVDALSGKSSGVFGGLIGAFLSKFTGVGAWFIAIFGIIFFSFAILSITPADIAVFLKNKIKEFIYNKNLKKQEELEEALREQNEKKKKIISEVKEKDAREEEKDSRDIRKRRAFLIDEEEEVGYDEQEVLPPEEIKPALTGDGVAIPYGNEDNKDTLVNINIFDEIREESIEKVSEIASETNLPDSVQDATVTDLSEIFTNDASISAAGKQASATVLDGADAVTEKIEGEFEGESESLHVTPKPTIEEVYHFPPINFLQPDPNPSTFSVTEELKQTSVKLVETLKNFGVKTKIMNICCGPTVTRYELQPEVGVRVRSIANLADDIALHLAASGVRIEAPIPGKDAVGIELPNKTVSTVYLRNLIETSAFETQKSKLTVALGMDVAGSPVFMNIEKMPHLLIAGATGMGKSVCINTFIVSMLYKARPDEVKLILIDPKKVELSIYNGLPHLLVPVVSDPKKAAGSLAWAVNEMERRFQLIEEVGVRNIDGYNEITKEDPEREYMPKIVIIIDELADLMMTARDEVETSICRLAQKARAAGMHLVIGTQRPSVDVITGLIKANVPSRIACTVASQIDSRTIIDVAGAEKLLGRGDMLYAPVGSMKPIRVQGSFVSEREIENIVEFLKNGKKYEYDADIIESIEREAARCGEKKKGRGSADSDGFDESEDRDSIMASDDAIISAIEIAVDSGSVSTSLLQRKLSLGYARAARIVDKLEKLGVVGPFEGSKPRKVLITREEFLEMRMNYEGSEE